MQAYKRASVPSPCLQGFRGFCQAYPVRSATVPRDNPGHRRPHLHRLSSPPPGWRYWSGYIGNKAMFAGFFEIPVTVTGLHCNRSSTGCYRSVISQGGNRERRRGRERNKEPSAAEPSLLVSDSLGECGNGLFRNPASRGRDDRLSAYIGVTKPAKLRQTRAVF